MNIGIIARADKTGLGNQTRNLVRLLDPFRVLVIDSRPFNNNEQFFDTYRNYRTTITRGFPSDNDVRRFLMGLEAVVTCETFYNPRLVQMAHSMGVRTYNQYNYELLDNLMNPRMPVPTKFWSPSYWHLEEMQERFPNVEYLPPPTFDTDFADVRGYNYALQGKPRFLHSAGRIAVNDRNGTLDLLKALPFCKEDFELVVKVQAGQILPTDDPRVRIEYGSPISETELYRGFHAMIIPRRYAGLCLPMNEALMSGLPVIMTDVEPNNRVLPKDWLVESYQAGEFTTRTQLPFYSAKFEKLARLIDAMAKLAKQPEKFIKERDLAYQIAKDNYSAEALKEQYYASLSSR
jgi:glycosyltransferase involved in cell wall biosynthesis